MNKKLGRRSFLKNITISSTAAALLPTEALQASGKENAATDQKDDNKAATHSYNGPYTGVHLNRLAFPMGGLGAGMICLEGTGALSHVSIRNRPEVFNEPGLFAALSVKGWKNGAKVLEGPVPDWKKFGRSDTGNGNTGATTGLPRFRNVSFLTRFPFGEIDLNDPDLPIKIRIRGWSPFIPTDDKNSSLPVAALEYEFINTGTKDLDTVFSYNAKNFLQYYQGSNSIESFENGFILKEKGNKENPFSTEIAFFTNHPSTVVDHCWFRGGWWDPITMAWNAVRDGEIKKVAPVEKDAPGASLYVPLKLLPGKKVSIQLMIAWYSPESKEAYGEKGEAKKDCTPETGCCNSPSDIGLDPFDKDFTGPAYKPYYSSLFPDIRSLAEYWKSNYDTLRKHSRLFTEAFYNSSLPPEVIEAVSANLSILKSPTVLRQFDGRLWNWEGCGDNWGCCHGSCTHVWNYAQAIPHLFPSLERSLRHTEFCENQDSNGHQTFRANLPISPNTHTFHAAADGQLGGIMKVYREWRISGKKDWLEKMYPMVKKSMDYCIQTWDPYHKGLIEEPHHNTYDIEFWGPDGMHLSFYIGALNAITKMGDYLGKDTSLYEKLAAKAKDQLETHLFDGEYFIQQIRYQDLDAKDPVKAKSFGGEYSPEAMELLSKEGPKYQYGKGCLSDGVLGAWIASMCGIEPTIDSTKLKSHLRSIHKYNLKSNLEEHANPQRPSYALGNEGGLLLCTWPKGGKLSLPFVYSDEVWTGIEHQVAAHLMQMGMVKEGLDIVRHSRNRYDGKVRNPFNEYECGHWYARALSSYGYLQALTGVRFDAVEKCLHIDSKIGDFQSFLSTESGFGIVSLKNRQPEVTVYYGSIAVERIVLSGNPVPFKAVKISHR